MAVSRQKWRRKGTTGCGIVLMSWKEAMNAPAGAVSPVSVLASAPRSAAANSVAVLTASPFLLLFTCAHARHSAPAAFTASKHYSTWSGTVLLPPLSLLLSLVYICLLVVESRRCLRVLLSPLRAARCSVLLAVASSCVPELHETHRRLLVLLSKILVA